MNIYLLSQSDNNGYDTYDSIVVCAESDADARTITPYDTTYVESSDPYQDWALKSSSITCQEIGKANANVQRGVILASFNAG